jgi:hypothetical protein
MLILIAGLAGLLSFGSATMVKGITGNEPRPHERIISHTIGSVETVKHDQPSSHDTTARQLESSQ